MTATVPISQLISLEGRRALVTGAASGIGRAIATRLDEAGAALILVDKDAEALAATAATLRGGAAPHRGRRPDRQGRYRCPGDTLAPEPPELLINNAGIYPFEKFTELDEAAYHRLMAVNLDATVWMCQRMIRDRGKRGGVIVNLASIEALVPFKSDLVHYSASKAGVIAVTRALAKEHARHGFRVNAVVPGGINTPGTRRAAKQVMKLKLDLIQAGIDFQRRLPLRRLGAPDEVARMVLVLCGELASYVHGAIIAVDGGFLSA